MSIETKPEPDRKFEPAVGVVRTRPRVDLHQLALYAIAGPAERRQIVLSEKYPSPFRMTYTHAKVLVAESLRLDWDEETLFGVAADRWCWALPETDLAALKRRQSIDAVVRLGAMLRDIKAQLARRDAGLRMCQRIWKPLELAGVQIAASPDAVLSDVSDLTHGLLSLRISRTRPHTEESARLAAALLARLADANRQRLGPVSGKLCMVVDAFSNSVTDADRGNRRRLRQLRQAAEEIAALWEQL